MTLCTRLGCEEVARWIPVIVLPSPVQYQGAPAIHDAGFVRPDLDRASLEFQALEE